MQTQKSFNKTHISSWVLLPLRLFLGITFIYAGIQKFTDPQFFHANKPGFIGRQMIAFANGSPIGGFLLHVVVPHSMAFGFMVAYGEIAIGLGILIGLLFRPAAFFGLLLSLIFFFSVTWHVYPYFYGADIVFVFCWVTLLINGPLNTGLPTVDEFLALNFLLPSPLHQQKGIAGILDFILGITIHAEAAPSGETPTLPTVGVQMHGNQVRTTQQRTAKQQNAHQRQQSATQKAREMRRSFLQGSLLGGGLVFGLGAMILTYRALFFTPDDTTTNTQGQGSSTGGTGTTTSTPTTTQGSSSTTAIAQVKSVAVNSSVAFTLPSSGDPGILVHLNDGKFVAYDALCTHAGCQVEYDPSQQLIVCPCHGAEFDPAKAAAVVAGPAPTPLTPVTIHVDSATGAITL
ncbi:MAG: Rieske 2Fe-2S domain-containing protein [Ktedonobacteraceae bacterium]|nr:Rieske 2Fe-2S domain-containing protein [Ktedonobacteraceae bacterium]